MAKHDIAVWGQRIRSVKTPFDKLEPDLDNIARIMEHMTPEQRQALIDRQPTLLDLFTMYERLEDTIGRVR